MSRPVGLWLALVGEHAHASGFEAGPATAACAPDTRRRAVRGWLVPADVVGDLRAYAQYYRIVAVVYTPKPWGKAAG
ncbi:MAG: hypothetical protein AUG49_15705 [Catenulispora sp. 13_1_20CM_3_70_7]|nr:MAG: hypothetical protein AUG49_15705 [Catenulispora sp. 13_1_20CM_3_70_7]